VSNQYSSQTQNPLQQLARTVCGFINCNQQNIRNRRQKIIALADVIVGVITVAAKAVIMDVVKVEQDTSKNPAIVDVEGVTDKFLCHICREGKRS